MGNSTKNTSKEVDNYMVFKKFIAIFIFLVVLIGGALVFLYYRELSTEKLLFETDILILILIAVVSWFYAKYKVKELSSEEAVRESEKKYKTLFNNSSDAIFIHDMKGRFVEVNDVACAQLGYSNDELMAMSPQDIDSPEFAAKVPERIKTIAQNGHFTFESAHITKDGRNIPVEINSRIIDYAGDTMILSVVRDIRERKEYEETLYNIASGVTGVATEEILISLVKFLSKSLQTDYVFIGKLIDGDEAIVRTIAVCSKGDIIDNFEYTLKGTPCEQALSGGNCTYPDNVQKEFPEDHLLVEMGIQSYAGIPLIDSKENLLGILVTLGQKPFKNTLFILAMLKIFAARATTEMERMDDESALIKSEYRLAEAQRIAHIGNWEWDIATGKIIWSDEVFRIFGLKPQEFPATFDYFLSVVHPDDLEFVKQKIDAAVTKNEPYSIDYRIILKDGSIKTSHAIGKVYYEEGTPVRMMGTVQDITDRVIASEALKEQQNIMKTIFATIPEIIVLKDVNSVYKAVNPAFCKYIGKKEEEIIGKTDYDFFPPDEARAYIAGDGKVMKSHEPQIKDEFATGINGKIWVQSTKTPVIDQKGNSVGILCTVSDISERKRLEEERQYDYLNRVGVMIVALNIDKTVNFINKTGCEILGYKRDEIVGKNWFLNFIPAEEKEEVEEIFEKFVATGEDSFETFERPIINKKGERRLIYWTKSLIKDVDGKVIGTLRAGEDVTYKRKMEVELAESEKTIGAITDSAQDAIYMINQGGNISYWNPAAEVIFGYSKAEALGRNAIKLLDPESIRQKHEERFKHFKKTGKSIYIGKTIESAAVKKSGKEFPVEISLSAIKIKGEWNEIAIVRDISQRKQAATEIIKGYQNQLALNSLLQLSLKGLSLELSLERSLDLILSVPWLNVQSSICIFLTDEKYEDTLVMKAYRGLVPPMVSACEKVHFGECICGKAAKSGQIEFSNCVGKDHTIGYDGMSSHGHYSVPILLDSKVIGVLCLYLNEGHKREEYEITFLEAVANSLALMIQHKRAELEKDELWKQLLQSQKMESVGTLAGGIAHDFNNNLTSIIGYSSLAYDILPDGHPVKSMVERVHDVGNKAAKLVSQLLAFSRRQILEMEVININTIIKNISDILSRIIGEDIIFDLNIGLRVDNIYADAAQIEQVLMNIVVNARHAMPIGGKLTIKTENVKLDEDDIKKHKDCAAGTYIKLSIIDTGIGMTNEVKERMFEPFFTTKVKGEGTGLGLSTVFGIIKQHNGFIEVDSALGVGTTFCIFIPAVKSKLTKELKDESTIDKKGSERILVVEDDESIKKLFTDILIPHGYKVYEAQSGEDALKICNDIDYDFDLLLTDVVMQGITGWELYEEVARRKPDIKVIFISGFIESPIVLNNIMQNDLAFIKKPLSPRELLKKLRETLDEDD